MAYFEVFRGTESEVDAQSIVDGQYLFTTDLGIDNNIYTDVGSTRIQLAGGFSSDDLSSTNLGTVTTHKILKKNGICEYKLDAISGTWTAGVSYTLATLDSQYRPSTVKFEKQILLAYSGATPYFAVLTIGAISGEISVIPRTNMSSLPLRIDETFISA